MRIDLSHLLKEEEYSFRSREEISNHITKYLFSFICIELEGLPKEEWEKTLATWLRILSLGIALSKLNQETRKKFYREKKFDPTMEGILEDVIKVYKGLKDLGLMKSESSKEFFKKIVELVNTEKLKKEGLGEEGIKFIMNFVSKL